MTSSADLGGRKGFGPIPAVDDDVPFHGDWERKVLALTLAMGASGKWNIDMSRHARESLPQEQYLSSSYYEIWLAALENLMVDHGLVSSEELNSGSPEGPATSEPFLAVRNVETMLSKGTPYEREPSAAAQFAVGDRVITKPLDHTGHTRLPGYLAGQAGIVEAVYGAHVFPDSSAAGNGPDPRFLYRVRFAATAAENGSEPGTGISADLWEPYLEPA